MSDMELLDEIATTVKAMTKDLKVLLMRVKRICPDCEGTNLNNDMTICFNCQAKDYE